MNSELHCVTDMVYIDCCAAMIWCIILIIISGMGPDYRLLVRQARRVAQQYYRTYLEPIPTTQLVQRLAAIMQEYTQSGYALSLGWL